MDRMEWLKERKKGLGGTDVAAILGLSKFKTAHHVWQDKVSDVITEIPDNRFMKWGRMLEATVAQAYAETEGREVQMVEGISRSKEHPFMIGSIDRFIVADPTLTDIPEVQREEGVLECKTVNQYAYQDWEASIPPYYYAQAMHYLYVTGLNWGAFGILIGGSDFRIFHFIRDQEFIDKMVTICVDFWQNNVQTNTPPDRVALDFAASKMLNTKPIIVSTEVLALVADLTDVRVKAKDLEAKEAELKEKIQTFMGDHDVLVSDNGVKLATWKLQAGQKRLNIKKLKEAEPEVFEKYAEAGEPTRVFRFTGTEV